MDNNKIKEKNKYIIDKYNKDVENTGGKYLYNNGSAAEKYVKQRVLNNMMSIYDFSNKTLLELGCGDGTFSLDFALLNPNADEKQLEKNCAACICSQCCPEESLSICAVCW